MAGDWDTTVCGRVIGAGGAIGLMAPDAEAPAVEGEATGAIGLKDPISVSTLVTRSPIAARRAVAAGKGSPSRFGMA